MDIKINKWCLLFCCYSLRGLDQGFDVRFGVFKLIKYIEEGFVIEKRHYKGFLIHKTIKFPSIQIGGK